MYRYNKLSELLNKVKQKVADIEEKLACMSVQNDSGQKRFGLFRTG